MDDLQGIQRADKVAAAHSLYQIIVDQARSAYARGNRLP